MKKICITLLLMLFFIPITIANDDSVHQIDKTLEECASINFMTAGMNKCTFEGIEAWNKEIIEYSNQMKKLLNKEELVLFDNTQTAWENYYNKEKEFLYNTIYNKDGDIHTTIVVNDLYELTKQRAINLKHYLYQFTEE